MKISSANIGGDTDTEVEVREFPEVIEIRMLTPRLDSRPARIWVDGREVTA